MTLTKEQVNRFTRKLYRFLDDGHEFKFRKMRMYVGEVHVDIYPTTISLDHRQDVISTLIHETLHYFYPDKSESWVLMMEKRIVNKLTDRQIRNILRRWAQNL